MRRSHILDERLALHRREVILLAPRLEVGVGCVGGAGELMGAAGAQTVAHALGLRVVVNRFGREERLALLGLAVAGSRRLLWAEQ